MAERKMWINRETLEGIANAIRSKKGTTDLIPVPELETEILSIVAGDSSWCGEYVDGTIYKTGAIVSFEGNIYICIKDLDEMQDPTYTEYWQMLNEQGETIPEISEALALTASTDGAEEGELVIAYSLSEKVALPTGTNKQLGILTDEDFIASNIKSGVNIFGLTGTYTSETVSEWDGTGVVIEAIASASLISFTIDGTSYQAEAGMTWSEWVASDYNNFTSSNGNLSIDGTTVKVGTGYKISSVASTDVIVAGTAYVTEYDSSSNEPA